MDLTKEEIERYQPYHTMPAFAFGFRDYMECKFLDYGMEDVDGQAYDRGAECAMRRQQKDFWPTSLTARGSRG